MADDLKVYNPQGSHTSSSIGRFVNYTGASAEAWVKTRAQAFRDFPGAVIVDGDDDYMASPDRRPEGFCRETREIEYKGKKMITGLNIGKPLAWYHSGISGFAKSGIVISREQYELLLIRFLETYGVRLADRVTVWI